MQKILDLAVAVNYPWIFRHPHVMQHAALLASGINCIRSKQLPYLGPKISDIPPAWFNDVEPHAPSICWKSGKMPRLKSSQNTRSDADFSVLVDLAHVGQSLARDRSRAAYVQGSACQLIHVEETHELPLLR